MRLLYIFSFFLCLFSVNSVSGEPARPDIRERALLNLKHELNAELATVKTRKELEQYLLTTPNAAINNLPPLKRELFIDSLAFSPIGLASFSPEGLREQSVSSAFNILRVFGLEQHIGMIPELKVNDEIDEAIILLYPASNYSPLNADEICTYMIIGHPKWQCRPGGSWCDRLRCNVQTP